MQHKLHKTLKRIISGEYDTFFLIAGPCAVESYEVCRAVAAEMKDICDKHDIPYIFKASYRKANRTSGASYDGIGDREGVEILRQIGQELDIAVTTDIHESQDAVLVQDSIDLIQIPAFLCRQTKLLQAAAATGLPVNIKKGQFMSAQAMEHACEKVRQADNPHVFLTERGNSFGYGDLVVDARNIDVMKGYALVVMDCTHATQRPNQASGVTGGAPSEIELFARLGLVAGAKGLFIETHPNPAEGRSDAASMLALSEAANMITRLHRLSQSLNAIYA